MARCVERGPVEDAVREQYDLRLAAGHTVHATQGLTLRVPHTVFVETFWDRPMLYTALSRAAAMPLITIAGSLAKANPYVHSSLIAFQARLDAL